MDDDDHAAGVLLLARKVSDNYVRKTGGREAVKLEALPEMFTRVRDEMLGAKSNLPEIYKARLRAKLNLPEPPKAIPAPPPAPAGK